MKVGRVAIIGVLFGGDCTQKKARIRENRCNTAEIYSHCTEILKIVQSITIAINDLLV